MFFLGFQSLIQDQSCLGGEESTTKGSFYILGDLSTFVSRWCALVCSNQKNTAFFNTADITTCRVPNAPQMHPKTLGSSSLGGFICLMLPKDLSWQNSNHLPIYFADFERKVKEEQNLSCFFWKQHLRILMKIHIYIYVTYKFYIYTTYSDV